MWVISAINPLKYLFKTWSFLASHCVLSDDDRLTSENLLLFLPFQDLSKQEKRDENHDEEIVLFFHDLNVAQFSRTKMSSGLLFFDPCCQAIPYFSWRIKCVFVSLNSNRSQGLGSSWKINYTTPTQKRAVKKGIFSPQKRENKNVFYRGKKKIRKKIQLWPHSKGFIWAFNQKFLSWLWQHFWEPGNFNVIHTLKKIVGRRKGKMDDKEFRTGEKKMRYLAENVQNRRFSSVGVCVCV